jgi:putative ABC transport system permease protein
MAVPPNRLMMTNPVRRADRPAVPGADLPNAQEILVSPGYFDTFGIRLRRGSGFTSEHRDGAPRVAIVNEEFVRRFFPDGDAIGGRIHLGSADPPSEPYEIIGVAPDVKYAGLDAAPDITVYVPYAQHAWWPIMYLVIRSDVDPLTLAPQVRREVAALDPGLPLQEVSTLEGLMRDSIKAPRLRTRLLLAFAITATLLAMTGIYGVMAFVMTQRLREMSIRMALGARAGDVARLVITGGLRLALVGALLGVGVAVAASRTFERFVFGIEPTDVRVLVMSTGVLLLAAIAATLAPAMRAARTQPGDALRLG